MNRCPHGEAVGCWKCQITSMRKRWYPTAGDKQEDGMKRNHTDVPPTIGEEKPVKVAKKADPKAKAKFAELKAKKAASRPAAKLTYGIVVNGKYQFVKQEFSRHEDALKQSAKVFNENIKRGLREIMLSFHHVKGE
jgi:hypothetical protein